MAHIIVTTKIIEGNLGEGWTDNHQVALALADLMRKTWTSDLAEYVKAGHTIEFAIEVEDKVSECDCGRSVFVTISGAENADEVYRLELYSSEDLTSEDDIWLEFCNNPPAALVRK